MRIQAALAAACAAFLLAAPAAAAHELRETVAPKFNHVIPNIPGKSLVVVEVDYAPGAASAPHTHARSAFIYAYVLAGEVESKVDDGPPRTYRAGEGWFEAPNAHHQISRNASQTAPAKLLAVFVLDSSETRLTTPEH